MTNFNIGDKVSTNLSDMKGQVYEIIDELPHHSTNCWIPRCQKFILSPSTGHTDDVFHKDELILVEESVENEDTLLREDKTQKPDFTYIAEMYPSFERILKRFQEGAVKYDRLNWRNAKDAQTYRESLLRHAMQYVNGQTDEEHLVATVINGLILLDLEERGVK